MTTPAWTLRDAGPEDGPGLLALTRATPMQADVSLLIAREPDFFALTRARGDGRTVVAEAEGEIVGCASAVRREARLASGTGDLGAVVDLKVAPSFRHRGLAQALLDALATREQEEPPAVYVAATAEGNAAVDAVAFRFGSPHGLVPLATMTSLQLLALGSGRVPSDLEVRRAGAGDREALLDLLEAFHARYVLAPLFDGPSFDALLARSPGMDLSSYRLALRDGRVVAAVADWDTDALKTTWVMGMPVPLRMLCAVSRALAPVLPVPALPGPGSPLRYRTLRHPACVDGEEAALRVLVRCARADARKRGEPFVLWTAAEDDPLNAVVRGLPATRYRYRVAGAFNRPEASEALHALKGRLVYDDPALA